MPKVPDSRKSVNRTNVARKQVVAAGNFDQGTLTEGEDSVRLTSSLWQLVLKKVNNVFNINRS
jgi:hypothetical protein